MGVAGDLSDLSGSDSFISRRIAAGHEEHGPGPGHDSGTGPWNPSRPGSGLPWSSDPEPMSSERGRWVSATPRPSSAIVAVMTGTPAAEVTGRGTGIDDEQYRNKIAVIERALDVNRPDEHDPLDVLAKVGGFEIGGIAGLILGAAAQKKPVVIDGFISTAGALIAGALCPASGDYMIAAHRAWKRDTASPSIISGKSPFSTWTSGSAKEPGPLWP